MNEAGSEEAALLARIGAGDDGDPLEEICRLYSRRIYGLGKRMLGDAGMAEELVQDTFVRLWRSAARFDPEIGSPRTFIYMIARRAAIDLQRRSASRPLSTSEELSQGDIGAGGAAAEQFEDVTLSLDVRDALETLSEKHRETLELCYRRDLSQPQIAERLGVPLGTVKTRVHYALKALRAELEERELV